MKKILLVLAALLTVNANAENHKTLAKNYSYTGFTGISVGNAFRVTIIKSDTYSVNVEINSKYEDYLRVKVDNGVLKISLENVPIGKYNISDGDLNATIQLPELTMLKVSGACKVNVKDKFSLGMRKFHGYASGASKINGLSISCGECDMDISGASFVEMDVTCNECDIDLSGASKTEVNVNANECSIDMSGAAKTTIKGVIEKLDIEASGASVVNAETVKAADVDIELSGASVGRINALCRLYVELNGASKCYYRADDNVILRTDISRGSSLKKL